MKTHTVIAEMVDSETGKRLFPAKRGEKPTTFTPHDDDQRQRLVTAGCLREGVVDTGDLPPGDDLGDKTLDELKTVVEAENVDLNGATKKADIIAAIRAKRTAA